MDLMQGTGREVASGERADAQIDTFISRRHERRVKDEGERAEEEMWMASSRRAKVRQDAEERAEKVVFHRGQAERLRRTLEELITHHETQAEKYLPKGAA